MNKAVAGLAVVSGKPYVSKQKIWDNGVFPHRTDIEFTHAFLPDNRLLILGAIRDALIAAWGPKYGFGILNQQLLQDDAAETIVNIIKSHPNNLSQIIPKLEDYLSEAKLYVKQPRSQNKQQWLTSKQLQ